jgi:hypothetical protein
MKDLAIAIGWGFQNNFPISPASPTQLPHQAYTPALRINPDNKNCCTTRARMKVDIVSEKNRDLFANNSRIFWQ